MVAFFKWQLAACSVGGVSGIGVGPQKRVKKGWDASYKNPLPTGHFIKPDTATHEFRTAIHFEAIQKRKDRKDREREATTKRLADPKPRLASIHAANGNSFLKNDRKDIEWRRSFRVDGRHVFSPFDRRSMGTVRDEVHKMANKHDEIDPNKVVHEKANKQDGPGSRVERIYRPQRPRGKGNQRPGNANRPEWRD